MIALLQLGDNGVKAAGEEAKVEHPAVRQAVEELVQPLQDDRPVDRKLVELYSNSMASSWIFIHKQEENLESQYKLTVGTGHAEITC